MPTISLCMITKNEEAYLEPCLNSVKDLVDEIIIVDTGSTDKTIEIANKFNAKIVKKPWNNDFSQARNESLKHATKDWILVLDADETITKEDHNKIKQLTETNTHLGFMLIQRSYTNDSSSIKWSSSKDDPYQESKQYSGWVYSGITRLFKNDKRIQFEYPVHETVKESIKRIGKIESTEIPIHHYGKTKSKEEMNKKGEMYMEIGKEKLDENKPKFYYELGVQAMVLNKFDEAITNLKKAIELNKQWPAPYISLGNIYCKQKKFEEAIAILEEAKKVDEKDSNIHNNLGVAYEMVRDDRSALESYKHAINYNKQNVDAYSNVTRILVKHNKIDEAIPLVKLLMGFKPKDIANYSNLGILFIQKKMLTEAIEVFNEGLKIEPDNKDLKDNIENTKKLIEANKKS
ncbi:MAG: tetratricopeptide repeat protein [Candidatus Woesearchaeota archaeon]|jgi:glycosyltransferase involved in cell wall biosynthesis|nr:tetratricopeptide repeat protein [Candidatus Woesearchaeota archaeon]MDP7457448.1 tetratricopeptide repeat protein [Candidatus Woesearchaeota archaeon]